MPHTRLSPRRYINARICVPKEYEQTLYDIMQSVDGDAVTFVDFHEGLAESGIPDEVVLMYNSFFYGHACRLNTELDYDLPKEIVRDFISYIELCTGGKVDWVVLVSLEVNGWSAFREIEKAISSNQTLKDCAFIQEIP